ncbi:FimV/HubP family polar landmark protein [Pseudomonas citronellolis]|uniref:FimV/HubP family polar landmark protein n=1 Tax=Pseudomonas citronellolis TaxID=53408 RepID=UPI0023E35607|nr:FimV/HubP family polar landmark protein [Pseudomonas citronellolis]MDF3934640.1 FimV/HubP family polar landmark protein [Pseudomonas citronellolis]
MVRLRKLVQAIAAASALTTGMAHALGLGDIHLHSALNQPLNADIDLTDVRDLSAGEIIPKLASPEDFAKSGVDRNFFLTGVKFTAVVQPNGKSVIHVTSDKPVQEPYLNFLVEVLWPNGRLLREYTVLLDPPLYSPQVAAAAAPRAPVAAPAPVVRQPVAPVAPRAVEPASAVSAPSSRGLEGNEYRTGPRDTLWEIASRARPDGSVTVNQTMLAIQDLNPDAFLGGNINRMKSGQVLRLPDAQQIRSRSPGEADTQVREQRSAWREGRNLAGGARQLDATQRASAGAAPEQAESKDSLRLVSGETGKGKGGDKGAKNGKALNEKLAVTQESLDSTRRANDELQDRMTDLQSQLDKLQKLIELKDAQLAKLQGELNTPPGQAPAQGAATPQPAAPASAAAPAEATPPAAAAPATPPPAAVQPAKPAEPKPAAPKPVVQAPAENQPGLIEELLANPTLLAAVGGSLVLVLLLVLLLLRRRAAQAEGTKAEPQMSGGDAAEEPLELSAGEFDSLSLDDEPVSAAAPVAAAAEKVAAQTSDPLGEADIYIAYGRFNQAAELLQGAIYDEPQRADLRLKLMEVLAEIGDREGFARQENELRELGGVEPQVEQLKSRYPGMVAAAAAAAIGGVAAASLSDDLDHFSLDDLDLAEESAAPAEPAAAPLAGADLDDAFDLGLDDLQFDDEQPVANPAPQAKADELSLEDFDLDAELKLDQPASEPAPLKADDDFAFDLDLDSDLNKAASAAPAVSDELSEFSLDLSDEQPVAAGKADDFLYDLSEADGELPASAEDEFSFDLGAEPALEPHAEASSELADDFDLSLPEETPAAPAEGDSFAAQLDQVSAELDKLASDLDEPAASVPDFAAEPVADIAAGEDDDEDEFDFLSGADEAATKLDLARAYIDMGDAEGARDILDEVISEGSDQQQKEARELLERLV